MPLRRDPSVVDPLLTELGLGAGSQPLTVLWDFDGVVADTEPLHDETYQELARRRSHTLADGYFNDMVGRTELAIWGLLIERGFPADPAEIEALMIERQAAYLELALAKLGPTWVAATLVPHFSELGANQYVVSNGDPDSQEQLLEKWGLAAQLTVSRRAPGEDKTKVLLRLCVPPTIVFEDNAGFLDTARQAGARTIAVQNTFNLDQSLDADLVLSIVEDDEPVRG